MSAAVGLWLGGALMSLFFAWILGHMQRTDARLRTERVLGLRESPLDALGPGEVRAARGLLTARDPLTCPVDGSTVVYYEVSLRRDGSSRGKALPPEVVHHEERFADAALQHGDVHVPLGLRGAILPADELELTRVASWRDGEWLGDTWERGGWSTQERSFVESRGASLWEGPGGELDEGTLTLRYRRLPVGSELLALGEVRAEETGGVRLASSTRFQLELTRESLDAYQRAQRGAHRAMQRASRAFVLLAVGLLALAGLTSLGVLS